MQDYLKNADEPYYALHDAAKEVDEIARNLLEKFNTCETKLFDLPSCKRIFLFIFTRAIKSYSAICMLCQTGYGQDASTLLRSLLENLITAKYIIYDQHSADEKARRFVDYKWIIFRRHLPEEEKSLQNSPSAVKEKFQARRKMILDHVAEFKQKYKITSDRALLTWSGKTVKDMAKKIDRTLLEEYESNFRSYSKFSHPTILGDNEYMIQKDQRLTFSPLPSGVGVVPNYKNAIKYYLSFLFAVDELFSLDEKARLCEVQEKCDSIVQKERLNQNQSPVKSVRKPLPIKESTVYFQTRPMLESQ